MCGGGRNVMSFHKMKNLIYQFWDSRPENRTSLPMVVATRKNIKAYADRIGAEYLFEENPDLLINHKLGKYFSALNPIFREEFHEYDNVLFLDADIFAVEDLEESIFEGFDAELGMCTEPLQPKLRANTKVGMLNGQQEELFGRSVENKWNITLPRNEEGLLKVFNGGVVLYSNDGMRKAKETFMPIKEYMDFIYSVKGLLEFYAADQNYIQVAMHHSKMNYIEMSGDWNNLITYHERNHTRVIDDKNENTKFVHIQFRGAYSLSEEQIWKITNLPAEEWGMGCKNVVNDIR